MDVEEWQDFHIEISLNMESEYFNFAQINRNLVIWEDCWPAMESHFFRGDGCLDTIYPKSAVLGHDNTNLM